MSTLFRSLAGVFLFTSCAWGSSPATDALVERLDSIRVRYDVPAFAVLLVDRHGTLVSEARGLADLAANRPVDDRTRFRIGSITKTFLALAVLRARQDGVLRLDDPVRAWLEEPPYENPYAPESPIRIDQLLENTAGLQDWVKDEWDLNDPLPLRQALAYRPESRGVRWRPGWHMSYSNNGAGIVARVLEEATGMSFETYMQEAVFDPLGMSTATLVPDDETFARLATGYDSDARTVIPYWHVIFRASAAMSLHPDDMGPMIRMFLNRGELAQRPFLTRADIDRMERVETTLAARNGLDYGYGPGLRQWQNEGHSFFGHGGDGDGYLAHFGYCPAARKGYFVVINAFTHEPLRRMRNVIESLIVEDLAARKPAGETVPTPEDLARVPGRYESATRRFPGEVGPDTIRVEVRAGRVYTIQGDRRLRLIPVGGGLYRRPEQSIASFAIVAGPDDRLYLQGPVGSYVLVDARDELPRD